MFGRIRLRLARLARDSRGLSALEYSVLLAVVMVGVLAAGERASELVARLYAGIVQAAAAAVGS